MFPTQVPYSKQFVNRFNKNKELVFNKILLKINRARKNTGGR